ncbi:MAG: hypothetical protein RIG63_17120 [Coleofasciculus chthonoplastes F3-SA18-01]
MARLYIASPSALAQNASQKVKDWLYGCSQSCPTCITISLSTES